MGAQWGVMGICLKFIQQCWFFNQYQRTNNCPSAYYRLLLRYSQASLEIPRGNLISNVVQEGFLLTQSLLHCFPESIFMNVKRQWGKAPSKTQKVKLLCRICFLLNFQNIAIHWFADYFTHMGASRMIAPLHAELLQQIEKCVFINILKLRIYLFPSPFLMVPASAESSSMATTDGRNLVVTLVRVISNELCSCFYDVVILRPTYSTLDISWMYQNAKN